MLPKFNLYGLMISVALLSAYALTARRAARRGLSPEIVWGSLPWVVGAAVLGARLYHVANYLTFYIEHLSLIPQVWRGGLGIYGGLVGGLIGLVIFFKFSLRRSDLPSGPPAGGAEGLTLMGRYLDAAAPGIALGQAIGRAGNIFNRENLPFAWWEIGLNLLIFVSLLKIEKLLLKRDSIIFNYQLPIFNKFSSSQFSIRFSLFTCYLWLYSLGRFILEFFRSDSPWVAGPLTAAQWVSLLILPATLAVFSKHHWKIVDRHP